MNRHTRKAQVWQKYTLNVWFCVYTAFCVAGQRKKGFVCGQNHLRLAFTLSGILFIKNHALN